MQHKAQECISPMDAFERMCIEVIQIEVATNAANTAMDECELPASLEARRAFNRAHALIDSAAEKAGAAMKLIEKLMTSVSVYLEAKENE